MPSVAGGGSLAKPSSRIVRGSSVTSCCCCKTSKRYQALAIYLSAVDGDWKSSAKLLDALPLLEELTRAYSRNPNRLRSVKLVEQLRAQPEAGRLFRRNSMTCGKFRLTAVGSGQMTCSESKWIPPSSGLKDFQRRTTDYVFQRMYLDNPPARRFLVADEVGLGKTMVARGIIAKTVEHLQAKKVNRIDILYICSNATIAQQNLNRLNVTNQESSSFATRLTLLPT